MPKKKTRPEFESLKTVIDGLAKAFGKNYEFVIHDFADPAHSLIYIAGNVTRRPIGAPLTERLLQAYRTYGNEVKDIINVQGHTKDGRPIRSSSIFIRDEHGKVIGSLGINIDLTEFDLARRLLDNILPSPHKAEQENDEEITFPTNLTDVLSLMIDEAFKNKNLVPLMDKDERLNLVRELEQKGVFLMKGSVEEVASRLAVSKYSIYSYIDQIRGEDKQEKS